MQAGDTHYQDRVVRPHELLRDGFPPVVKGFTFDGCHITGPAVLMFQGAASLNNCHFEGAADGIFIQMVPEQEQVTGVIVFEDCVFDRCRFVGIGVLDRNRELRSKIGID